MQNKLDFYILKLKDLQEQISKDVYGANAITNAQKLERIKRDILRDFSYNKIKIYLI
jgi:intergrase/recombinase